MTYSERQILTVAIGGIPGSGKTTLARALAMELAAAMLDLDTLTNPLMAQIAALTGAGEDLDHASLRGPIRDARYACLRDTAAEVIRAGCPAVLVAPFTIERSERDSWAAFSAPLAAAGGRVVFIEVVLDPAVASSRRAIRSLPRDRSRSTSSASGAVAASASVKSGVAAVCSVADLGADGAADPAAEATRLTALIHAFGHPG